MPDPHASGRDQPPVAPRVDAKLQPMADGFARAYPLGRDLISAITGSGWILTFVQPVEEFARQNTTFRPATAIRDEWLLRARPPAEIAQSFDLQIEVLFYVSYYDDLQARTVQVARQLVDADPRVSRDVLFLVTGDEAADNKILQMPRSEGVVPLTWGWVRSSAGGGQGDKPLRARLEKYLYSRDLFDVQIPVVGNRFFGRHQPLQYLRRQALLNQPVGVFGLRKIGKTSLIKAFVSECGNWTAGDPGLLAVHIDLQAAPIGRRDYQYLLWDIGRSAYRAWLAQPTCQTASFKPWLMTLPSPPAADASVSVAFDDDVKRLLETVANTQGSSHLVIVFDEIERLVPTSDAERGYDGAVDLLRYLRGLSQQGADVSMILAGANPYLAERASIAGQENPILNFVLKYYLPAMEEDEVRFMIARLGGGMGVRFHHDATAAVLEHAAGHPFLTRQLCSATVRRLRRSRPLTVERRDVEDALGDYSASQHHTFAQMFESLADHPDEQFLLRQLAHGDGDFVAAWAQSDPVGIEHLKGYGLLEPRGPGWGFTIPLFHEYVLNSVP
jgi:hypothetical protein